MPNSASTSASASLEPISSTNPPSFPIERGDTRLPDLKPSATHLRNPHGFRTNEEPTTAQRLALHELDHLNASRTLGRISDLANGSSADRTQFNIQRCISAFGRHNTGTLLPPKPRIIYHSDPNIDSASTNDNNDSIPARAGPDTGSSKVQIAILMIKINALADNLSNKDKHNKRNLRLMVHSRRKLLAYPRKKERGGPRWRNLVEELRVRQAMWRGGDEFVSWSWMARWEEWGEERGR
jgi:ribosomal protein S15